MQPFVSIYTHNMLETAVRPLWIKVIGFYYIMESPLVFKHKHFEIYIICISSHSEEIHNSIYLSTLNYNSRI